MIEILSWNIQNGRGVDGRVDLARIAARIREPGAPDVICLQEVSRRMAELDGGAGDDQAAVLAAALPGYQAFFGAAIDLAGPGPDARR